MMHWHFNANGKAADGGGFQGGKSKRQEGEKTTGAERRGDATNAQEVWETVQDFHYL